MAPAGGTEPNDNPQVSSQPGQAVNTRTTQGSGEIEVDAVSRGVTTRDMQPVGPDDGKPAECDCTMSRAHLDLLALLEEKYRGEKIGSIGETLGSIFKSTVRPGSYITDLMNKVFEDNYASNPDHAQYEQELRTGKEPTPKTVQGRLAKSMIGSVTVGGSHGTLEQEIRGLQSNLAGLKGLKNDINSEYDRLKEEARAVGKK
jgi:hypothetical protein